MVVLGSTGSIGTNTLEICKRRNIAVEAICCAKNVAILNEQISKFNPEFVCVGDENLRKQVRGVQRDKIFVGASGLLEMIEACKSDIVVNSLVGFAGLAPSLKVQSLGKKLALANKESLVVGGKFLDTSKIEAIDSEHFGLKFLLSSATPPKRLIITASGGAFYRTPIKNLRTATANDALKHPNWSMGAKITIDSATMANKLFEVMEAFWLYGVRDIDAVIEPTSMIHALVEFVDGSTTAHISATDMKLAIAHAVLNLAGKRVEQGVVKPVNLLNLKPLKFSRINLRKYPIFTLKEQVLQCLDLGVVINAANEIGVAKFLRNECGFLDISRVVLNAAKAFKDVQIASQNELFEVDKAVREWANLQI